MLKDDLRREIDHVMETFKRLDANASGGVSREEFRKGIQVIGLDASPHDVDVIFDDIDRIKIVGSSSQSSGHTYINQTPGNSACTQRELQLQ